jgi:hypothetical protein
MAIIQKAIMVCNFCGNVILQDKGFHCYDVPNEGYSLIMHKGKSFDVKEEKDYCCFDCIVSDMKKEFGSAEIEGGN